MQLYHSASKETPNKLPLIQAGDQITDPGVWSDKPGLLAYKINLHK